MDLDLRHLSHAELMDLACSESEVAIELARRYVNLRKRYFSAVVTLTDFKHRLTELAKECKM